MYSSARRRARSGTACSLATASVTTIRGEVVSGISERTGYIWRLALKLTTRGPRSWRRSHEANRQCARKRDPSRRCVHFARSKPRWGRRDRTAHHRTRRERGGRGQPGGRRHDQDRRRLRADRRRVIASTCPRRTGRSSPSSRSTPRAASTASRSTSSSTTASTRWMSRPRTAKQFVEQDKVPAVHRLHGHRLGARDRPRRCRPPSPVHHGRRDLAEAADPGRQRDVPGLLRR